MLIKILLIILLFLYPLGQLERIPLNLPGVGFYFHDVIIGLLVFLWLAGRISKKEKIEISKAGKYIFLFALVAFFSFLVNMLKRSGQEVLAAGFYLGRWISYAGLYLVIKDLKIVQLLNCSIVKLLIIVGSVAAGFGILQYVFYPDIRPLTVYGWDPHYWRVVGTYLEPGFAGLIFVLTMILVVIRYWSNWSKISWLLLALCYSAFALTYSRSAYLAYLLAMLIIALVKKSWKFLAITLAIFALTLYILPRPFGEGVKLERQSTFWSRLANWREGLKIWRQSPIFGVGFNFYRYAARDAGFLGEKLWASTHAGAGVDNSFLFVLATTGIAGFFLYILMLFKILSPQFKNINQQGKLILFTSFASCGIHAMFNNSLFYPWIMIWLWILAGFYGV